MSDWHEHEAKAECLDLRATVRQLEHSLTEARAEVFRLNGSLEEGERVIASSEHKLAAARAEIERLDKLNRSLAVDLKEWRIRFPSDDPTIARRMVEDRAKAEVLRDIERN